MDSRETAATAIVVVVFAAVAGLFFLLADQVIRQGVAFLLALSVE